AIYYTSQENGAKISGYCSFPLQVASLDFLNLLFRMLSLLILLSNKRLDSYLTQKWLFVLP
ncbi:MAG: hypothetical protein AAF694_23630, partial [Bacteroidota bacterium]